MCTVSKIVMIASVCLSVCSVNGGETNVNIDSLTERTGETALSI